MKLHKICWTKKRAKPIRKGTPYRSIIATERYQIDRYAQDERDGSWTVTPTLREKTLHATKGWRDRLVSVGRTKAIGEA